MDGVLFLICFRSGHRIWLSCFVVFAFLVQACTAARTPTYTPTPNGPHAAKPMTRGSESIAARCEVELDIFSGMPNPTWVLTNAEADTLVKKLAGLSRTSATELSGNLGYRGFIVQCTQGADAQLIRIQAGTVHISEGARNVYAYDKDRQIERWLLNTGKPHLNNELFEIAEREFR